jgi:hypothetical protein
MSSIETRKIYSNRNFANFIMVQFLDPETDVMVQFLAPEIVIMGERNYIQPVDQQRHLSTVLFNTGWLKTFYIQFL